MAWRIQIVKNGIVAWEKCRVASRTRNVGMEMEKTGARQIWKKCVVGICLLGGTAWGAEIINLQTQWEGGVLTMPCTVNGLRLRFIFDTGASSVCSSSTEALFMLKNGYLDDSDIGDSSQAVIANGDIVDNTEITLRDVEVGGIHLQDVAAIVTHGLDAPLLFGQSAIRRLGTIQIHDGEVTIIPGTDAGFIDASNNDEDDYDSEEFKRKGWLLERDDGTWYLADSAPIDAKLRFFMAEAKRGDFAKMVALGNLYCEGDGVAQDFSTAFQWYRKAAENGIAVGQFYTGLFYWEGKGVRADRAAAKHWFAMAAAQGDVSAQHNLAAIYTIEGDFLEAGKWFRKAAMAGNADAQFKLALLYANGWGTTKNNAKAAYWYQQAANQGHAGAMNNLGLMYEEGIGVPQNKNRALSLYRQAMHIGEDDAKENYDRLSTEKRWHDENLRLQQMRLYGY